MIVTEKKLIAACVMGAAAGIIALFVLSLVMQPAQLTVPEAEALACSKAGNNAKVRISGFVDSVSVRDNYALITVAGSETIEAVSFDTSRIKKLGIERFQPVEITGELRNYNGKPSLVISKLRLVNGSCGCGGKSG